MNKFKRVRKLEVGNTRKIFIYYGLKTPIFLENLSYLQFMLKITSSLMSIN